jgi:hypothetical protein
MQRRFAMVKYDGVRGMNGKYNRKRVLKIGAVVLAVLLAAMLGTVALAGCDGLSKVNPSTEQVRDNMEDEGLSGNTPTEEQGKEKMILLQYDTFRYHNADEIANDYFEKFGYGFKFGDPPDWFYDRGSEIKTSVSLNDEYWEFDEKGYQTEYGNPSITVSKTSDGYSLQYRDQLSWVKGEDKKVKHYDITCIVNKLALVKRDGYINNVHGDGFDGGITTDVDEYHEKTGLSCANPQFLDLYVVFNSATDALTVKNLPIWSNRADGIVIHADSALLWYGKDAGVDINI